MNSLLLIRIYKTNEYEKKWFIERYDVIVSRYEKVERPSPVGGALV